MIIKAIFWVESRQLYAGIPQYFQTSLNLNVGDEIIAPCRRAAKSKGRVARAKVIKADMDIADVPEKYRDMMRVVSKRYVPPERD